MYLVLLWGELNLADVFTTRHHWFGLPDSLISQHTIRNFKVTLYMIQICSEYNGKINFVEFIPICQY
jgi:hypothetical protein